MESSGLCSEKILLSQPWCFSKGSIKPGAIVEKQATFPNTLLPARYWVKSASLRSNSIKDRFKKKQPARSLPSNTTLVFLPLRASAKFRTSLFQPSCGSGSYARLWDAQHQVLVGCHVLSVRTTTTAKVRQPACRQWARQREARHVLVTHWSLRFSGWLRSLAEFCDAAALQCVFTKTRRFKACVSTSVLAVVRMERL